MRDARGRICELRTQRLVSGALGPPEKSSSGLQHREPLTASFPSVRELRRDRSLLPMGLAPYETFGSIDLG